MRCADLVVLAPVITYLMVVSYVANRSGECHFHEGVGAVMVFGLIPCAVASLKLTSRLDDRLYRHVDSRHWLRHLSVWTMVSISLAGYLIPFAAPSLLCVPGVRVLA
ncbi:MAG: hypothetical protein RLZZ618_3157 [Pseudomonadota bacterium]|jgi:hypothetical protein